MVDCVLVKPMPADAIPRQGQSRHRADQQWLAGWYYDSHIHSSTFLQPPGGPKRRAAYADLLLICCPLLMPSGAHVLWDPVSDHAWLFGHHSTFGLSKWTVRCEGCAGAGLMCGPMMSGGRNQELVRQLQVEDNSKSIRNIKPI